MTAIAPPAGTLQWTLDANRRWVVITGPTREPVSLEEARSHLRLTAAGSPPTHPDDTWIRTLGIPAARQYCEGFCMRSMALQTIEMQLARFPGTYTMDGGTSFELFMGPLAAITELRYLDSSGVEQDASGYGVTRADPPAVYLMSSGASWPNTLGVPGAVRIRYQAGYSVGDESPMLTPQIPEAIKIAILMMLASLYENREAIQGDTADSTVPHEIPLGVQSLLRPYVLRLSMA